MNERYVLYWAIVTLIVTAIISTLFFWEGVGMIFLISIPGLSFLIFYKKTTWFLTGGEIEERMRVATLKRADKHLREIGRILWRFGYSKEPTDLYYKPTRKGKTTRADVKRVIGMLLDIIAEKKKEKLPSEMSEDEKKYREKEKKRKKETDVRKAIEKGTEEMPEDYIEKEEKPLYEEKLVNGEWMMVSNVVDENGNCPNCGLPKDLCVCVCPVVIDHDIDEQTEEIEEVTKEVEGTDGMGEEEIKSETKEEVEKPLENEKKSLREVMNDAMKKIGDKDAE